MGHHDTALRAPMGRAKGGAMRDVGEGQCAAPGQLGLGASAPTAQPGSPRAALRFTCLIVGEAGQIARLDILDHTLELVQGRVQRKLVRVRSQATYRRACL